MEGTARAKARPAQAWGAGGTKGSLSSGPGQLEFYKDRARRSGVVPPRCQQGGDTAPTLTLSALVPLTLETSLRLWFNVSKHPIHHKLQGATLGH